MTVCRRQHQQRLRDYHPTARGIIFLLFPLSMATLSVFIIYYCTAVCMQVSSDKRQPAIRTQFHHKLWPLLLVLLPLLPSIYSLDCFRILFHLFFDLFPLLFPSFFFKFFLHFNSHIYFIYF